MIELYNSTGRKVTPVKPVTGESPNGNGQTKDQLFWCTANRAFKNVRTSEERLDKLIEALKPFTPEGNNPPRRAA